MVHRYVVMTTFTVPGRVSNIGFLLLLSRPWCGEGAGTYPVVLGMEIAAVCSNSELEREAILFPSFTVAICSVDLYCPLASQCSYIHAEAH